MAKTTECSSCPERRHGVHFAECPTCGSLLCPDCVGACLDCWSDANPTPTTAKESQ